MVDPVGTATTPEGKTIPRIIIGPKPITPDQNADDASQFFRAPTDNELNGSTVTDQSTGGDVSQYFRPPSSDEQTGYTSSPPSRQVGTAEAMARGGIDAASYGTAPIIAGAAAAAGKRAEKAGQTSPEDITRMMTPTFPEEPYGAQAVAQALADHFSQHPDPDVQSEFERGRQDYAEGNKLSIQQKPWAYLGGALVGSVMTAPPVAQPGMRVLPRLAVGAAEGALGGGAYGAGSTAAEGGDAAAVARGAARGATIGAVTGGAVSGAIGPRIPAAAATPGQRAANTAAGLLNTPLGRGAASDSGAVQSLTGKAIEVPFAGHKISENLQEVEQAAGRYVGGVAEGMGGGTRAGAGAYLRPAVQQVIDKNKAAINAGYNGLRSRIDPNAKFTMPRTQAAVEHIAEQRRARGWTGTDGTPDPYSGFEKIKNMIVDPQKRAQLAAQARQLYALSKQKAAMTVGGGAAEKARADKLMAEARKGVGASFNGLHGARQEISNMARFPQNHPGLDAGEARFVREAVSQDLREIVGAAAGGNPRAQRAAQQEYDRVEAQFGPLKELNDRLQDYVDSNGEGLLNSVLDAAKEKRGDVRLLTALRGAMRPDDFEVVGGQLLSELGRREAKGGEGSFSLSTFATNWEKLSPEAKRLLFSSNGHLQNIEDVVAMGKHIKLTLDMANKSHTGGALIAFDTLKTMVEGAIAAGAGAVGAKELAASVATFGAANATARLLAKPKNAAAMGRFARSFNTAIVNPTPARVGVLTAATRDMANTLGIDPNKAIEILQSKIQALAPGRAENQGPDKQQPPAPGRVGQ